MTNYNRPNPKYEALTNLFLHYIDQDSIAKRAAQSNSLEEISYLAGINFFTKNLSGIERATVMRKLDRGDPVENVISFKKKEAPQKPAEREVHPRQEPARPRARDNYTHPFEPNFGRGHARPRERRPEYTLHKKAIAAVLAVGIGIGIICLASAKISSNEEKNYTKSYQENVKKILNGDYDGAYKSILEATK